MSDARSAERYRLPARVLRWLVALAIPFQMYLGWASEFASTREAEFRLIRFHYGGRVGLVAPRLAAEVRAISSSITVFAHNALVAGPSLSQGAVHTELLARQPAIGSRPFG